MCPSGLHPRRDAREWTDVRTKTLEVLASLLLSSMSAPSALDPAGELHPEILLVEDEQIVALELRKRLTRLGYQVTEVAVSGEAALHSVEERRPDLVLMDIVLAGRMTGTQAAAIIREHFDIPVVYLTAFSDPGTLEQIKDTEGQGFLTKPFQPHELHAVIQLALSRHRKERSRREIERSAWEETSHKSQEQLDQFTRSAGHDLQQPLRTARAFLELLARRANLKLDEDERKLLREAQGGLAGMSTLLQDLVVYAQAGHSEGAPLPSMDANTALAEALGNLQEAVAESKARVVHNDLPTVRADPRQLLQVFQNLLGNAIKYRRPEHTPVIHVSAEKFGGEVVFSVKDNGIGFEPQYAESIFEPFKRLHGQSAYPGTGIGLAICRKIIDAHGGKIWANGTPGRGAVFFFTLPDHP